MIDTTPLKAHRFASGQDLMALFQAQLDRFPRVQTSQGPKRIFSEFGGFMIRPRGETRNRLTHFVFPDTVLSVPSAGRSLRAHTDRTFPQVKLMAEASSNALFACIMADRPTVDALTERVSLVVPMKDVLLTADLWDYFSSKDQHALAARSFGPGMSLEQWAQTIDVYSGSLTNLYEIDHRVIVVKELPMNINQRGMVGTNDSFHTMPGLISNVLLQNCFSEDGLFFEIGSAHVHPKKEYDGWAAKVAHRVGERVAHMTPSPSDVRQIRGSQASNEEILSKYVGTKKNTGETFVSIVGVDRQGQVSDIRHFDFGLIDDAEVANVLNDQTLETMKKDAPDVGLIAAHYEFFSSPSISADQLGGDVGQHVGDATQPSTP